MKHFVTLELCAFVTFFLASMHAFLFSNVHIHKHRHTDRHLLLRIQKNFLHLNVFFPTLLYCDAASMLFYYYFLHRFTLQFDALLHFSYLVYTLFVLLCCCPAYTIISAYIHTYIQPGRFARRLSFISCNDVVLLCTKFSVLSKEFACALVKISIFMNEKRGKRRRNEIKMNLWKLLIQCWASLMVPCCTILNGVCLCFLLNKITLTV